MMPTSAPSNNGFTLIEMMVVLTIVGLMAAMLAPRIGKEPGAITRAHDEAKLTAALQKARLSALAQRAPVSIEPASIVRGATVTGTLAGSNDAISFYPDGSSSGGTIRIGGRDALKIDWLTGGYSHAG